MQNEFGMTLGNVLAVYAVLMLFGVQFNALVGVLGRRGYTEGFLSVFVAGGVLITLSGVALLNWQAALLSLGAFAASGLPMMIGSMVRYIRKREAEQRAMKNEMKNEIHTF